MTDVCPSGTEWVPRVGLLELPAPRAALIRGLFELAAFVADHPELPMPWVSGVMIPCEDGFQRDVQVVGDVAKALGVPAGFGPDGAYVAERKFGPMVRVRCVVRPIPCGVDELYVAPITGESR